MKIDNALLKPAFGYRIDYAGRSVVLAGDTRHSENLIKFAKGTDWLNHEVVSPESLKRAEYAEERAKIIIAHHTTPEEAGALFSKAKPRGVGKKSRRT